MPDHVLIVGGGITGAALAYRLASAGRRVTVVDAGQPNATAAAFGWINASFYLDLHHHRLRAMGIAAWHRLLSDVPLDVTWSGCLCWDMPRPELSQTYQSLERQSYPAEWLRGEAVTARVPALREPPEAALWLPTEGALRSQSAASHLMGAAKALGVRVMQNVRVDAVLADGQVDTSSGRLTADTVVIAAGTGTQGLAKTMGVNVPMVPRPAYILRTSPYAHRIGPVLASPIGEIRQEADGGLLMPVAANHQADTAETLIHAPDKAADAAMIRLRGLLKDADDLRWTEVLQAERPVPKDGFPVAGHLSDAVYVACFHSGITLAPIMAELITEELTASGSNLAAEMLAPYRPQRFEDL